MALGGVALKITMKILNGAGLFTVDRSHFLIQFQFSTVKKYSSVLKSNIDNIFFSGAYLTADEVP